MPPGQFDKWYIDTTAVANAAAAAGTPATPASAGKKVYSTIGCMACHSIDGSQMTGPTFKGAFGHEVTVKTAGKERTITVDEAYIKHSILEPNDDIVKGFNANLMQTYKGQLNDQEIANITEFIKSLK
jgi:cytochrome c oxidase subunit 2